VEWSEEIYTIMEWEKLDETIAFEDFRASVHPDDLDYLDKKTVEIFGGVASFDLSHRVITKSGVVKWVRQLGRVNSKNGEVISMEGVLQDISAFKATELELTNRNNFIEKAIDNLPLGIAVNDMDTGEVTLINKKFSEIYGWPIEMLTDIYQFFDCVYPDKTHRDKMKSLIFSDIESDDPNRMHWKEIASTTQTGEVRIVDAQNIALPNQRLMISTVMDVTERIKNQKALLLSNQRYEYASKASFDAMWDYDVDSKMVYWGSGMEEHFGYKLLNGSSDLNFWIELIHKEEREAVVKQINRALLCG
jgi:PAS domain S-box-containing protein